VSDLDVVVPWVRGGPLVEVVISCLFMHRWRLLLALGGWPLTAGFAGSAEANFVDASEAIVNGCIFMMAFIWSGAILPGVFGVLGQAMGPTIIQMAIVAFESVLLGGSGCSCNFVGCIIVGRNQGGFVCSVVASGRL
jgi:hypothetical protein